MPAIFKPACGKNQFEVASNLTGSFDFATRQLPPFHLPLRFAQDDDRTMAKLAIP
jgi:hypothetical protein